MSDFIPKPAPVKTGGLSPKAQKLAALREKAATAKIGLKQDGSSATSAVKAKTSFTGKKTAFQRKAT